MKTIKRKSGIASAFLTELLLAVRTRAQHVTVFDVKQHWNRALTLTNINTNTKGSSVITTLTLSRTGHETNSRGRAMVADGAVRERARPREVVRVS